MSTKIKLVSISKPVFSHSVVNRGVHKMRTQKFKVRSSDKTNYTLIKCVMSTQIWEIYCLWHHVRHLKYNLTQVLMKERPVTAYLLELSLGHWYLRNDASFFMKCYANDISLKLMYYLVVYYHQFQNGAHENLWGWNNVWTFEIGAPLFNQCNKQATVQSVGLVGCLEMFPWWAGWLNASSENKKDAELSYHPPSTAATV